MTRKKQKNKLLFVLPSINKKILIGSVCILVLALIAVLNPSVKEWIIAPFCSWKSTELVSPAQTTAEKVTFIKTSFNPQKISATITARGCQFLQTGDRAITYNLVTEGYLIGQSKLNIFATRGEKIIDTNKILQEQVMFDTANRSPSNVSLDIATTGDYILFKQFSPSNNYGSSCSDKKYIQNILSSTFCLDALDWHDQEYPNDLFPFLYIYKKGNATSSTDGFIITLSNKDSQSVVASRTCWKGSDIRVEQNKMTIPFALCATEKPEIIKNLVIDIASKQVIEGSLN